MVFLRVECGMMYLVRLVFDVLWRWVRKLLIGLVMVDVCFNVCGLYLIFVGEKVY